VRDGFYEKKRGRGEGRKGKERGKYFIIYSINDTVINAEIGIVIDVL
jgi:hypothetical protein